MKKKHRRQFVITAFAYLFLWTIGASPQAFGAASGNYTDLLPIGAAGNTTVISNGSGWSLTTLPPTQTFGDSLSRLVNAPYQSTGTATIQNTTAVSTFTADAINAGKVGSTTFPATWVATGRSIRITMRGYYNTTGSPTWNWGIKLGTTTVLQTGAIAAPTSVSTQSFSASVLMTINATGASGTVNANYDIFVTTAAPAAGTAGSLNTLSYSTATYTATAVDLTSQLTVNPVLTWGTGSSANTVKATNVIVEFIN